MEDIPFDPDFDSPSEQIGAAGVSPRVAFWAGVAIAVLGFGTVGLIVLLVAVVR